MRKVHVRSKDARTLLLMLTIVFAAATIVDAEDGLSLVEAPQVPIDPATQAGSTLLQLKNGGQADVSVSLVVTEFRSKITGQLLSTKVTFSLQPDAPGKPVFPQTVKKGDLLVLKVDVSNMTEAGESTATIFQGGQSLGVLTAVNDRAPFGVRPDGAAPDKVELSLERGAKTSLTLKNDDAVSYRVSWRLLVNGVNYDGEAPVILAPNGSVPVEINPPGAWFEHWVDGIFKPDDKDGVLTLAFTPSSTGDGRLWPSKSIPIKVHLNYWPAWVRQVFGNAILLLVLVAGGIASLLVNAYLPNRLRSVAVEEKLSTLGRKISGISTNIDSRVRVLIRVERLRIKTLLKSRNHFSPDFADALTQSNEGVTALALRIETAEQLDSERHRFDALRSQLPPTRLCTIDDDLQRAAELLLKCRPSPAEIELAKADISKASELISKSADLVDGSDQDDDFAKHLARRLTQLQGDLESFKSHEVYKRFESLLPGPFRWLTATPSDLTTSSPRNYTAIDTDLAKLAVILDYVRVYESSCEPAFRAALEEPEKQLTDMLIPMSWDCIRSAQLLVRQMESGVYEKDLRDQLPQGVSIELDRQVVRVNEPIEFSLRFHRPSFDRAPAREEWSYAWDFGDGHEERGWSAWHYYPNAEEKKVHVYFLDSQGRPIKGDDGEEIIKIPRDVVVQAEAPDRFGHRTKVEMARLAIGLLVAVVALAAGAKEQLLKLDVLPGLLAVFIIGFAADTVKNLITQAPARQ